MDFGISKKLCPKRALNEDTFSLVPKDISEEFDNSVNYSQPARKKIKHRVKHEIVLQEGSRLPRQQPYRTLFYNMKIMEYIISALLAYDFVDALVQLS